MPLLLKSENSSLKPSSVAVQHGLCPTSLEILKTFSRDAAHIEKDTVGLLYGKGYLV